MSRLFTETKVAPPTVGCSLDDRVMLLGSCFASNVGDKMLAAGFDVCINPFGTLYNPLSIAEAVDRLDSGKDFTPYDCIRTGSGLVCSFEHHTSFARSTEEEFLHDANASLNEAREFWKGCNKAIITLGTAFVWEHRDAGPVANCLKRDSGEFRRFMLDIDRCASLLLGITGRHPEKEFIFTVSPIRHLGDDCRQNTLSKATLHLAVEKTVCTSPRLDYFPAWEILCDELRDYRFYTEDLVHPSRTAIDIIWERFIDRVCLKAELPRIEANEKEARRRAHIPRKDYSKQKKLI